MQCRLRLWWNLGLVAICCSFLSAAGCCTDLYYEILSDNPTVQLPKDEDPHCSGGEWWYYTGELKTSDGAGFGIEAVIFHVPGWRFHVPINGWAAHYAILDRTTGKFIYDQGLWIGHSSGKSSGEGFHVTTPLIEMEIANGRDHLQANLSDGSYALDLSLTDSFGPVFHNGTGYVAYGSDLHSFYYSRPKMTASGTLEIDGQQYPVTGELWFDRQWGRDLMDPTQKWDWFSLRLDDGSSIMFFVFREDTTIAYGTYIPPSGEPVALENTEFSITPTIKWVSPHTGIEYPVGWTIEIVPQNLALTVRAVADDQEVDAETTTFNIYWEGLCDVEGTRGDQPIGGIAYVEMTNYPVLEETTD